MEASNWLAELKPCDRESERECDVENPIPVKNDDLLAKLLHVDEKFTPLLDLLGQFSGLEDKTVQFNRKLRQFEAGIEEMCPDVATLKSAFSTLRAASLLDRGLAQRLAAVGACITLQQRQNHIETMLLNVVLQETFNKLRVLEQSDPKYLINAAHLMGDYFAGLGSYNGNKIHILGGQLLDYMRALLASDDLRAHRCLATQLMRNGHEIYLSLPQEINDISISIHLRLLTPLPVSFIWLLYSAELCENDFLPFPSGLQKFYDYHLSLAIYL